MGIVVLGSTGTIGTGIIEYLQSNKLKFKPISHKDIDITSEKSIKKVIKDYDVIINTIGIGSQRVCEEDPIQSFELNTKLIYDLLRLRDPESLLVNIGTAAVFDDKFLKFRSYDSPNPKNVYGMSKYLAELMMNQQDNTLTIRTSAIFGKYRNDNPGILNKIIYTLIQNKEITATINDYISPTYNLDLAEGIFKLIDSNARGVYHIVNEGVSTIWDFAFTTSKILNSNSIIRSADSSTFPPDNKVKTLCLQSDVSLRNWRDALGEYINEL